MSSIDSSELKREFMKSKTGLITLTGNIVIKKNNNVLTGEKGYMNLKNRKSRIESSKSKRVKGVFAPSK